MQTHIQTHTRTWTQHGHYITYIHMYIYTHRSRLL